MSMFLEFLRFELKFRAKSLSTYVYFLMWLAFTFFSVASESFGPVGNSNGKVLLNGPYANTLNFTYAGLFGMIVIAAIFGTAALRDFQRDTYQILFTKPVGRLAYLGGRWAGSLLTTVFVFSGLLAGTWLGSLAPWADHARIGPNRLDWYLVPFLTIVCVQIFVLGSLFFTVAALTRRLVIVYVQGVALFMAYVIGLTVFSATRSLEHFWSGILDPVGPLLIDRITRYWTVVERNSQLLPLDFSGYSPGVFLYNRLLWVAVGMAALFAVMTLFPLSVEALTARSQGRRAARERQREETQAPRRARFVTRLPTVHAVFGAATTVAQYLALTRLRLRTVLREVPFWALVGMLVVFAVNNGYFAGRVGGVNVWPVTYLMVQAVEGAAMLFFLIVAVLYAAELLWRERDVRFAGIHDALPMPEWVDWLSRFTAIVLVEALLLAITMAVGVIMQSIDGYHHYELAQYLKELYLVTFPQVIGFTLFAMFVQTLVSNKFVGHAIVIGVFLLQTILFNVGWENTLYLPGAVPAYTYSDMNGYGHFVPALAGAIGYWLAIFAFLGLVSIAYARRGPEESFLTRTRAARARAPRLAPAAVACLAAAAGIGGWYFYETHVRNEYLTANDRRRIAAGYERDFKRYENLAQPKITAVDANVDLDPPRRSFHGTGSFTLVNKSGVPIPEIHLTDAHDSVRNVRFDRPFHVKSRAPRDLYTIYALESPLEPGQTLRLSFEVEHVTHGFTDGHEPAEFAYNGTFFDAEWFPSIGYDPNQEIDDPRRRREQGLGEQEEMAPRGDAAHSRINLFTPQADWITYHTVVSTTADQTAIAPGYPTREWTANGRHYFEYDMGATPILDFFAYLSGRYQVQRETVQGPNGPIALEVYYDPAHPYNVPEMLEASRDGLDYFQAQFSPYQFRQYRIMEFPRYRTFAQSFPNTVPFSEGIGFITRLKDPKDIDLTYFVTAHELAHQWWAHQLVGAQVEGSNMMSETLAQYSAYELMQRKHGKDYMHRVLHHFLDRYLRGRAGEVRRERPLALVQRESYVWYEKGGQIMYTLADSIGVDRVNAALREFLIQYRYANADGTVEHPYPDTRQLEAALRAHTPPEYQYLIDDGFERIVLYDNKVLSAVAKRRADGKYEVTLEVQARKVQADGNGNERPMPLDDFIEIGVFKGAKDEELPLDLHKERMTAERARFTVVVDEKPTRAGIDPYNKLIDRIADDNLVDVTE